MVMVQKRLSYIKALQMGSVHKTEISTHLPLDFVEASKKATTRQATHDFFHVHRKGIYLSITGTIK